ncbi:N-lysine methyltransferase KMT5A-B [Chelonus insularis]|uniref:N-lysine methyltransferase KMT5A-B n=1 Tax=Chelonus insularis TaxID=460826 RepID=UPI00158B6179|nr:N-lysine methyltransferase KMT5A-B [Chelonus insularis]
MVKGRRKRAPVVTNTVTAKQSSTEANDLIISPFKKEIKLEKNPIDEKKSGIKTRNRVTNSKSSVSIASYFPLKVEDVDANMSKASSLSNCISADQVLLKNEENIKSELEDIVSIKELFKTDETPVAVPCQNSSTPHRINMPNIQIDDTDKAFVHNTDDIKIPESVNAIKPVGKKNAGRSRAKLKFHSPKNKPTDSEIVNANHKVTEYFPVRRSIRKSKKTVLEEKQRLIAMKVLSQTEDGLEVRHFVGKGRGVVTTREFCKGEFVVEYIGELIDQTTAKKREAEYAKDQNTGCYMYYFQHRNQQYCVDATAESDKLGRLVNHSRNGNLIARVVEVEGIPHLVLTAKEDIPVGVELTYDYGDRSRESIRNHPWLAL